MHATMLHATLSAAVKDMASPIYRGTRRAIECSRAISVKPPAVLDASILVAVQQLIGNHLDPNK